MTTVASTKVHVVASMGAGEQVTSNSHKLPILFDQ